MITYKHGNAGIARTEEHKEKLRAANLGSGNPMHGKTHTPEIKAALSSYRKQIRWINNGTESKQIPKNSPIPEGWIAGRPASLGENVHKGHARKQAKKAPTNQ